MSIKINSIIDELKTLSLLEATELVNQMEKVFGIDTSISSPTIISSMPTNVTSTMPEVIEEKTSFDILITEVPADKKIAILKVVRNVTGLGLKESKDIVDNVPKILKEGVTKEESESIKKELETAGAKVNIK